MDLSCIKQVIELAPFFNERLAHMISNLQLHADILEMEILLELESIPTGHWYALVVHTHQKVAANALQLSSNKSQHIYFI
jgi:hypothetical protein